MQKIQSLILVLSLTLSFSVNADNNYSSKLNNQSKQAGNEGYYLVKDSVWGENGCILESGKEKIAPGESNTLIIKNGCKWGGIRYKIFKVTGIQAVGSLGHSFHEGNFSIDITAACQGTECNFVDLDPTQAKKALN